MSITYGQAEDLIHATYGDWSQDDPEWQRDMIDMLCEYPSVKALRREESWWVVPPWWPGASGVAVDDD